MREVCKDPEDEALTAKIPIKKETHPQDTEEENEAGTTPAPAPVHEPRSHPTPEDPIATDVPEVMEEAEKTVTAIKTRPNLPTSHSSSTSNGGS